MEIFDLPLSETFRVVAFYGNQDYSIARDGHIVHGNGKFLDTSFSNKKQRYQSHKLYYFEKLTDDIVGDFYLEAGLETPITPLETFTEYLKSNGVVNNNKANSLFVIVPKTSKKLIGKKHLIEFNVGCLDFGY